VPSFGPAGQSLWLTEQNAQTRRYVKQTAEIPRQLQFPDNYFKQTLPPFNIHRGNWFYVSAVLFVYKRDKSVFGNKRLLFPWTRTVMVSELILHFPCYHRNDAFLGALANSRRGAIRFMSAGTSVFPHGTQLPLHGCSWNLIFEYFWKSVDRIQVSLKSGKNNMTLRKDQYTFYHSSLTSSYNEKKFHTKVVGRIKTHFLSSKTLCRKSRRLWDNMEKYCRAGQTTYENTVHAHCMLNIQGHKYILRLCNTYYFSTATMVPRTRLSVTFYVKSAKTIHRYNM
jgi:hypothetical protein